MGIKKSKIANAEIQQSLEKIVVNVGIGRLSQQANFKDKLLPRVMSDVALVTGQKPKSNPARKSIAGFKLRQGTPVGVQVTLRRARMVDFFTRFITIVLPRVRDFRGIDTSSVDARGVLNVGFREQYVFPEIHADESPLTFSLGVNVVPRARGRDEAIKLYHRLGVPLKSVAKKSETQNAG